MKRKKQFVAPRVIQQVEVCLEGDLLVVTPSTEYSTEVYNDPIESVDVDLSTDTYDFYYD